MRRPSGYTLIELLVSLFIFAVILGFVGLNSYSTQISASRETEARNRLQDTLRVILLQIGLDLEQVGGSWTHGTGLNAVNCVDPEMPCLVIKIPKSDDATQQQESDEDSNPQFWLGVRYMNTLSQLETSRGCNQIWYVWKPELGLYYKSVSDSNTCDGVIVDTEDDSEDEGADLNNTPKEAELLLDGVLGFNVSVFCRNKDGKLLEATYSDSSDSYAAADCGSSYPSMARVSLFAVSEANNAMDDYDRTAYYAVVPDDAAPLAPRCIESLVGASPADPPDGIVACPVGKVCACLEQSVDLPNFRFMAFP